MSSGLATGSSVQSIAKGLHVLVCTRLLFDHIKGGEQDVRALLLGLSPPQKVINQVNSLKAIGFFTKVAIVPDLVFQSSEFASEIDQNSI